MRVEVCNKGDYLAPEGIVFHTVLVDDKKVAEFYEKGEALEYARLLKAAAPAACELVARLTVLLDEVNNGIIVRTGDGDAHMLKGALKDAAAALCARSEATRSEIIEECAKVCDDLVTGLSYSSSDSGRRHCAAAIRSLK